MEAISSSSSPCIIFSYSSSPSLLSSSYSSLSLLLLVLLTCFSFILQSSFTGVMHSWSCASSIVVYLFILRLVFDGVMYVFDTCVHYVYRSLDVHYVFGDYRSLHVYYVLGSLDEM